MCRGIVVDGRGLAIYGAEVKPLMRRTSSVYILRNQAGQALYVGMTSGTAERRLMDHRRADWWQEVAEIEIEEFATRWAALEHERALIALLRPVHNHRR